MDAFQILRGLEVLDGKLTKNLIELKCMVHRGKL